MSWRATHGSSKMRSHTHSHCGFSCCHQNWKIPLHSCWFLIFSPRVCVCIAGLCFASFNAWFSIEIILRGLFIRCCFFFLSSSFDFMLSTANSTHLLCMALCMFTAIKCIRRVSHSIGIVPANVNALAHTLSPPASNCVSNPFRDSWIYLLLTIRRRKKK